MNDAIEVIGLAAMLHPDGDLHQIKLTLRCNGRSYREAIDNAGESWSLMVDDLHGPMHASGSEATHVAAILSAMLEALDDSQLQRIFGG